MAESEFGASGVTLRDATPEDDGLIRSVFHELRGPHFLPLGLDYDSLVGLLDQQYGLRAAHYSKYFPAMQTEIVVFDGKEVGYVMTELNNDLRIIDFAIVAPHRNEGLGTAALNQIIKRADSAGLPIRLMVESYNPARNLYDRHGFVLEEEQGMHLQMIRPHRS